MYALCMYNLGLSEAYSFSVINKCVSDGRQMMHFLSNQILINVLEHIIDTTLAGTYSCTLSNQILRNVLEHIIDFIDSYSAWM